MHVVLLISRKNNKKHLHKTKKTHIKPERLSKTQYTEKAHTKNAKRRDTPVKPRSDTRLHKQNIDAPNHGPIPRGRKATVYRADPCNKKGQRSKHAMPPPPPGFALEGTYLPAPHLPGSPTPAVVAPPLPPTPTPVPSPTAPFPHLELEPRPIRRQPCLSLEMRGGLASRSTHGLPPAIPPFFQGLRGRREREDGGVGSAIIQRRGSCCSCCCCVVRIR